MRKSAWLLLLLVRPAADTLPALQLNLQLWERLRSGWRAAPDVTQDAEYRRLVAHLPASGEIGLVQVNPRNRHAAARVHYYLQYALAPRRIIPSTDPEFVVVVGRPAPGPGDARMAPAANSPVAPPRARATETAAFISQAVERGCLPAAPAPS